MTGTVAAGAPVSAEPNRQSVKTFVTETLGCRCPESVFEHIEYQGEAAVPGLNDPLKRLVVGRRLLIYFLESDDAAVLRTSLPRLIRTARDERDRAKYNRVRVVVLSDHPDPLRPEAERSFSGLDEVDARMHLHVLARSCVRDLF